MTLLIASIYFICLFAVAYNFIHADFGKETDITITDKDGKKVTIESDTHSIKSIKL